MLRLFSLEKIVPAIGGIPATSERIICSSSGALRGDNPAGKAQHHQPNVTFTNHPAVGTSSNTDDQPCSDTQMSRLR